MITDLGNIEYYPILGNPCDIRLHFPLLVCTKHLFSLATPTNSLIHAPYIYPSILYTLATITFAIIPVGLFPFFFSLREMTKSILLSPACYCCCCFRDLERGSNERVTFIVFSSYCMVDYVNPCKHGESVQAGLFFHISHICMYSANKKNVMLVWLLLCWCILLLLLAFTWAMHCESCQVHRNVVTS